jgi:hypothetical protein
MGVILDHFSIAIQMQSDMWRMNNMLAELLSARRWTTLLLLLHIRAIVQGGNSYRMVFLRCARRYFQVFPIRQIGPQSNSDLESTQ